MKTFKSLLFFFFFIKIGFAQVANYNQFPTMQPQHILDDNLTNISFAFSMRVLNSDYDGPLVRLRKQNSKDPNKNDKIVDFGWADSDIVDVAAINAWKKNKGVLYIVTWYDQSGEGRDATQTEPDQQPRFYPDANIPYFQGDGVDDHLTVVNGGIQDVTNGGNEGTVLGVMKATNKSQHSFGVLTGSDRWSTHLNWTDNNLYFDPGICCNNSRSFNNSSNVDKWQQYSFIKTSSNAIARAGGLQKFNVAHTTSNCTRTENFAIGWATGDQSGNHATTSFSELIMYKTDKTTIVISEIEENTITFWSL